MFSYILSIEFFLFGVRYDYDDVKEPEEIVKAIYFAFLFPRTNVITKLNF